jgi:DNA invertase Pin-like site-specific DNA recombinase
LWYIDFQKLEGINMPRKSQKAKLILDQDMKEQLRRIANSRTAPVREVQRANILQRYAEGMPIIDIEKMVHISRPTIYKRNQLLQKRQKHGQSALPAESRRNLVMLPRCGH